MFAHTLILHQLPDFEIARQLGVKLMPATAFFDERSVDNIPISLLSDCSVASVFKLINAPTDIVT
jgi:hypothetical protein